MPPIPVISHPDYDITVPPGHRFVGQKFSDLMTCLAQRPDWSGFQVIETRPVHLSNLRAVHDSDYIADFAYDRLDAAAMRRLNLPWSQRLLKRSFLAVNGTYQAAQLALQRGIACHAAGGTHHAHRGYGAGFCVFNDLAFAAHALIRHHGVRRVLILDLDVHQGDGTIDICAQNPAIYTASLHGENNFPFEKRRGSLDITLPDGMGDSAYLAVLSKALDRIWAEFEPEFVIYDAGVDVHTADGLGRLSLSDDGILHRDIHVMQFFKSRKIPVTTAIGGGYSRDRAELARRHSIVFAAAHAVYGDADPATAPD